MRDYKSGEPIIVITPEGKVDGTIISLSPDRRHCLVRIDDAIEILTETRMLKTHKETETDGLEEPQL